jgi:hypothetical protein
LRGHRGNIQKVFHGTTLELASKYQGKSGKTFVGYSLSASRFEAENFLIIFSSEKTFSHGVWQNQV